MDRIEATRVFVEVADRASFTAAAARLGMSKALASKQVAALERAAGVRLLHRTTRKLSLTEAGEAFLGRAYAALDAFDSMMDAAGQDPAHPKGILRIAAPKVYGEMVLAEAVAVFLKDQPHLEIELICEERRVDIVGEGFDMALRLGALEDSSFVSVRLAPFPYVVCAAPDYIESRGDPVRPADLGHHDCIVNTAISPHGQWAFRTENRIHKVTVPSRIRVNSDSSARQFTRAGLGIGLCIRAPLDEDFAAGRLVPVLERFHAYDREVVALLPHRTGMPAKTRVFLDFLKHRLRSDRSPACPKPNSKRKP